MIDILLLAGTITFVVMLVVVSKWSPNDGQTFQVIAQLAGGFGAAFLTRAKMPEPAQKPNTIVDATIHTDTTEPKP